MNTAEETAAEMVPGPIFDDWSGRFRSQLGDDSDWIPLEPQAHEHDAQELASDARGIIARLIERVRAEQAADIQRLRDALLWFADEGHYTGTYRHGAGFVDAVGLGVAREALGLPVERADGSEMPLDEALRHVGSSSV